MADEGTGNASAAAAAAQPEVMEIKTETGQVFKGTPDEIIAAMKQSVENGSSTLRQYKEANEQLTRSLQSLQTVEEPEPVAAGSFDTKKYFKMLAEDPLAAADYMDVYRYGETREEMMGRLNEAHQTTREVRSLLEIQKFKNMVGEEYPGTPEVSQMIWQYGDFDRNPVSAAAMLSAYTELKQAGRIKPVAPAAAAAEPVKEPAVRRAPPSARGTGGRDVPSVTDAKRYEKMSLEQIKAEMAKINGQAVQ